MGSFVDRKDFYRYDKPELEERTKNRLTQIAEAGMEEVGVAELGVSGVMSGLYIERVWDYSDNDFDDYMKWAKGVIARKR